MASRCFVTTGFEDECRQIHDACNQQRQLSLLLARRSPSERQQIKAAYRAMFGEDLAGELHKTLMANQEDELCKLLYLQVLDPAERDAIMARDAVEGGGATDYRVLVEIFTRRKQNQLFFTKQAYVARFKRNLEQDMVTEPSHPYQRLLVALATSHKSHHDELSRHIAKCDARRLYDAKNSGMGSVNEAVILEMFSKRTKQAYVARFKRNLEQDMVTEPSHPYQRLLVALATSHKSHHDELSRHIAKCDARRLYDAKNSGMGSVNEAVILEMFSKRTKQAYVARFKRNLEQDMVTEPSHPYQRLLVALATSHKSHHDELSRHIAKCDARRLYDAKNSGMGSVNEAVILEMFSKRSIPQLRLAFCSYKHIYGRDYTKALKKNGFGEFEQSLRVVVKCIYSPSMYFSKLLHRSLQCSATNKRLVTRAILGSDDVDMDKIKSVFKSSCGKDLEDFIQESLPESDYRDFLVSVAKGSMAS